MRRNRAFTLIELLVVVGSKVDAASPAPDAGVSPMEFSAAPRPETTVSGSLALKYVPRPLTAVCQKSSIDLLSA